MVNIITIAAVVILSEYALSNNLGVVDDLLRGGATLGNALLESPGCIISVGRLDVEPSAD